MYRERQDSELVSQTPLDFLPGNICERRSRNSLVREIPLRQYFFKPRSNSVGLPASGAGTDCRQRVPCLDYLSLLVTGVAFHRVGQPI